MPPLGDFDLAERLLRGAGERALLVAEQFALEQRLGNRRAVDGDEARVLAAALRMHARARCSSLPVPLSPRISTDTSAGATFSIMRHTLSIASSVAISPSNGERSCASLQLAVLLLELVQAERAAHDEPQHVRRRAASDRNRRRRATPRASRCRGRALPVITMTRVCGARLRISLSVRMPSLTPSASGGRPEILQHHRRFEAPDLRERFFAIARDRALRIRRSSSAAVSAGRRRLRRPAGAVCRRCRDAVADSLMRPPEG